MVMVAVLKLMRLSKLERTDIMIDWIADPVNATLCKCKHLHSVLMHLAW